MKEGRQILEHAWKHLLRTYDAALFRNDEWLLNYTERGMDFISRLLRKECSR